MLSTDFSMNSHLAPSARNMSIIALISSIRGTFSKIVRPSTRSDAASKGRVAFFDPLTVTSPCSGFPPYILILATASSSRCVSLDCVQTANAAMLTSNTAAGDASTALSRANTAINTANIADGKADSAIITANSAVSTAGSAASTAGTALSTANTADSNATTALNNSSTALQQAGDALIAAGNAVDTANAADGKANTAINTANSIAGTANTALLNANDALDTANGIAGTANDALDAANNALIDANTALQTANNAKDTANGIDSKATTALYNSNSALIAVAASLKKADNLSDLTDVGTARTNLGLGTAALATVGNTGSQLPTASQVQAMLPGDATTSVKGIVELATDAEAQAGTSNIVVITAGNFAAALRHTNFQATTSQRGAVELATASESIALLDTTRAVTPSGLGSALRGANANATTTTRGTVELATSAEAQAGTDAVRALTPSNLVDVSPYLRIHRSAGLSVSQATVVAVPMDVVGSGRVERPAWTISGSNITVPAPGVYVFQFEYRITDVNRAMAFAYLGANEIARGTDDSAAGSGGVVTAWGASVSGLVIVESTSTPISFRVLQQGAAGGATATAFTANIVRVAPI